MTTLPLRTFDQIIADQTATLSSSLSANSAIFDTLNLTPGSPLLALMEANGGLVLLLQWINQQVLNSTRMQTSVGSQLDSFGADFLFARYPAVPATGQVLFTRATANNMIYIPTNTLLRTLDGLQSFTVIVPDQDILNIFDSVKGYRMDPNVYSISCLVQAVTPGTIGNIAANYLMLQSPLSISKVTNPSSFYNGVDSESDAQFVSRFRLYINSLSRATPSAIENAIVNTNPSYTYTILENYISATQPQPGCLLVTFDNGTGFPSAAMVAELQTNVNAVRGACITPFVQAASTCTVSVSFDALFASTQAYTANAYAIQTAITNFINGLSVGENLYLTQLSQIIYNSSSAVLNAWNVQIVAYDGTGTALTNSPYGDITVSTSQVLRFIPNPPSLNGVVQATASIMVIDPSYTSAPYA
jgi:uncharacterized phage protein gp47/JayE